MGPRPLLNGYRRAHFDYAFDYRTVDFDRGGIDSYATFGRTFDLFGDGSIRLAYTPGHSAGHMSVVARLAERDFVIGGDADLHRAASSTAGAARRRAPSTPTTTGARCRSCGCSGASSRTRSITPGHDPEFYAKLERRATSSEPLVAGLAHAAEDLGRRPRAGARGSASSSTGKLTGSPNWTVTFGKRQPLPAPHPGRAVDRDRDHRRAGFQRDPADPRLGLAQLAAARAPALGVDQQHLALVEDRVGGLERLLVVVAAAHREDAAVLEDVGRTGGPKSCDLAMKRIFRRR